MSLEVERAVAEVTEPVEPTSVSRFLKNRKAKHADSDYHPTHNKSALATLPDLIENRDEDSEREDDKKLVRESVEIAKPESRVSERDIHRLKQATSHLPFDTVLKILAHYHYNVPIAIAAAQQMSVPDYMGQGVRRIFAANVVYEREKNPTRLQVVKEFYMASKFRKHCDTKTLVDFYYQQKNRIDSNWRLEMDDEGPLTVEQRAELQEKMMEGGIRFCRRDQQNGLYKGRHKRSHAARRAHQLRREQKPGCSKDRDDVDSSDAVSVASSCHSQVATSSEGPSEPKEVMELRIQSDPEVPVGESAASPAPEVREAPEVLKTPMSLPTSPTRIPKVHTPKSAPTSPSKHRKVLESTTTPQVAVAAPESESMTTSPPEPSSESSSSTTSSTSALLQIPKFRFNIKLDDDVSPLGPVLSGLVSPPTSSGSTSSASTTSTTPVKDSEGAQKVKKTYKKRAIEELRGGAQKTYPDRERRPRKIFE